MIAEFCKNKTKEYFQIAESNIGGLFEDSARDLLKRIQEEYGNKGLTSSMIVYSKIYLSDIVNQAPVLRKLLCEFGFGFYSFIGQAPASGGKIAVENYFIDNPNAVIMSCDKSSSYLNGYKLEYGELRPNGKADICSQTNDLMSQLSDAVNKQNGNILRNLIRTWIYIRDIDKNYKSMVSVRRENFDRWGLTSKTHYIASTGIDGCGEDPCELVGIMYLNAYGVSEEQIHFLEATSNLCATSKYGVTFERGTRVVYGDRAHYFISGTASIDANGDILYSNDVEKQFERVIENISSLLVSAGSGIDDLKYLNVYLRDFSDYSYIDKRVKELKLGIPYIILHAPVCREGWLVELEGVAINGNGNEKFLYF